MKKFPIIQRNLAAGRIKFPGRIKRFLGGRLLEFEDGWTSEVDILIYATGYRWSFPFLEEGVLDNYGSGPELESFGPLAMRSIHVRHPGLVFVGLMGKFGALQYAIEWSAILAAWWILGKVKKSKQELEAQFESELQSVRQYDPALRSLINTNAKKYSGLDHVLAVRKFLAIRENPNAEQEKVLRQLIGLWFDKRIERQLEGPVTDYSKYTVGRGKRRGSFLLRGPKL